MFNTVTYLVDGQACCCLIQATPKPNFLHLFLFLSWVQVSIRLSRMGSNIADKIPGAVEVEGSETNIEIKIKTLDSQTYTLRVDKQVISGSH